MGGEVEVVVRRARAGDAAARTELVRLGHCSQLWDTFIYFFFQELTLECCVLGGAVLFIFCGVSAPAAAAVLPAAAALVAAAVTAAALAAAADQAQRMRHELLGLVAEARGPLLAAPPARLSLTLRLPPDAEPEPRCGPLHAQLVGTVSVSSLRGAAVGARPAGWLHALAVHPQWRRRGVGRALEAGAARAARAAGLRALEASTSHLQPAARALLHAQGWECRGAYARPLCGAALSLPVARLARALPDPALDLA